MKTSKALGLLCGIFMMFSWMLVGCGGGGSDSAAPAPILSVDQSAYDFGSVTTGKTATLQATVSNDGTADLSVDDLTISDLTNFTIASGTCGAAPYTLAAGEDCTVVLTFTPTTVDIFSETLTLSSNDGDFSVALSGEGTAAAELNVSLNQIDTDACPTIKAYVTVTDQNDFLVEGLDAADFEVTENTTPSSAPDTVASAPTESVTLAAGIVMDYSGSVTGDPVFVSVMESGATSFVNQLGENDQGEIVKFGTTVSVIQPFTTDKDLLRTAITGLPDLGTRTALYDAIYEAIEDAAATTATRRAVILLTDGVDNGSSGVPGAVPGSVHTMAEVVALAQSEGVPVFTIGTGLSVDPDTLQDIADQTGGQYFEALTTDRVVTIYTQLAEILNSQYVLTYTTPLTGADVDVTVKVLPQPGDADGDTSDPLTYSGCP